MEEISAAPEEPKKKVPAKLKWSLLSMAVVAMLLSAMLFPGPLNPTVQVKAEFGTPYDTDLYIYRVHMYYEDATSWATPSETDRTHYYWDVFNDPSSVKKIPAITYNDGAPSSVILDYIMVEVNIYDHALFKDSDPQNNSYCRMRWYTPEYDTWTTWQIAYPDTVSTYFITYTFEENIFMHPDRDVWVLQIELWGTMAG